MKGGTRTLLVGFAAGVVAGAALPVLMPMLADIGRPVAKAALKHSLLALERIRIAAAQLTESFDDLLAEVRAEVEAELAQRAPEEAATAAPVSGAPVNGAGAAVNGGKPSSTMMS